MLAAAVTAEEYFLSKRDINIVSSLSVVYNTGVCMYVCINVRIWTHKGAHIIALHQRITSISIWVSVLIGRDLILVVIVFFLIEIELFIFKF